MYNFWIYIAHNYNTYVVFQAFDLCHGKWKLNKLEILKIEDLKTTYK